MSSKKLVDNPADCVRDAVEGILLSDARLRRIGNLNILVRHDIETVRNNYVTIISGGGSGHEPAHAGYVGEGMLSAAVLGNVFASPSVSAILAAIRVCSGPKGVLLIVKNYTGDRLNFGMAMEKARQERINVQMVIVDDDCALEKGKGITGGRGVAGTVFVHKVAGAAAAAGLSLEEVTTEAQKTVRALGTLGIALSTCTVPGAPPSTRLSAPKLYEVGMGIHGEPGREQRELPDNNKNATVVGDIMCEGILGSAQMVPTLNMKAGERVVVLLNNLGGLPAIEMSVVAKVVVRNLVKRGLRPVRVYIGPFMTALEMAGVSLTILRISEEDSCEAQNLLLSRIDAATSAPAWSAASVLDINTGVATDSDIDHWLSTRSIPYDAEATAGDRTTKISGGLPCPVAVAMIKAVCQRIIEIEPTITEYDSVCGDGDCGLVMKAGATKVLSSITEGDATDSAILCDKLADAISASMGGTSGALLEIFFRAAATYHSTHGQVPGSSLAASWIGALCKGLEAIKFYGGAGPGMRTMLDALEPGICTLQETGNMSAAASAAQQGMESTKTMASLAGRSNYVEQQRMNGIPDPGAAVVAETFHVAGKLF